MPLLYTLIYVLPLYLSKTSRPCPQLSRDAPSVIRARVRAVTFSCTLTSLVTIYIVFSCGGASLWEALRLLGYWPISAPALFKPLFLSAVLFAGPLFERGIVESGWRSWAHGRHLSETLSSWTGWRNYVAGPVTEELLFRSHLVPLHLLANIPPSKIVFLTPLYFGVAHIHHFYEYHLTHPHTPLLPALISVLVQFGYTSLFGFFATFVFLRTGSLWSVVLIHSFCNWCGLPRFWGRVEPGVPLGPPGDEGKEGSVRGRVAVADGQLALVWTVAYYVILVAGVVGFFKWLWVLTDCETGLVTFGGQR